MSLPPREPVSGPPQLVATIGPRSDLLARELALGGATAFRLNASHLPPPALDRALARLREACPSIPVVVDLQGAKMRLGSFEPRAVAAADAVHFALGDSDPTAIPLPHRELFEQARRGDRLAIDDGRLVFDVEGVQADRLSAVAARAGTLLPRKGVTVEPHPVILSGLTAADREACRVARAFGVELFAFSFMSTGAEAGWVRAAAPGCLVIGKIERAEASEHLEAIARAVDGVWICRGDLGAELGPARLARVVAGVEPRRLPCPVLMAGQVLEHLTHHPEPTRSEVCHLHDLLARGYAGIVLSDETAIGRDPLHAVVTAAALLASLA
jgi:pyruvate kinase